MALTAGTITEVSVSPRAASLVVGDAVSGTTPYSYQWYRSTTSGFTPSGSNDIEGATARTLSDTDLVPGTTYYYKNRVTDSAATPATADSVQETVVTPADEPSQNQFDIAPYLGMTDLRLNYNTISVMFDPAGSGVLYAGSAVKVSTASTPETVLVVPSTARADEVFGFVNYNIKNSSFLPGSVLEISQRGNVMFLMATAAINRGQQVINNPAAVAGGCNGGVGPVLGSGAANIVGFALDTVAIGQLVRIELACPSFLADGV